MIPKDLKMDKNLKRRLKLAAGKPMTKEEVRRQRISFVYGNLPSSSTMTREEVEKIVDKYDGQ